MVVKHDEIANNCLPTVIIGSIVKYALNNGTVRPPIVKNPNLECSYEENLKYYYQSTIMRINKKCFLLGCYDEKDKQYKMRIFDHKDNTIASSKQSMLS